MIDINDRERIDEFMFLDWWMCVKKTFDRVWVGGPNLAIELDLGTGILSIFTIGYILISCSSTCICKWSGW